MRHASASQIKRQIGDVLQALTVYHISQKYHGLIFRLTRTSCRVLRADANTMLFFFIFQTPPYLPPHSICNRRRKCISNHTTCGCLALAKIPVRRETLNPRYHFFRKLRIPNKVSRRRLVGNTKSVNTKFIPRPPCPCRPKIRPAVLLAPTHDSRGNFVCSCNPSIKAFPSIRSHQFPQCLSNGRCGPAIRLGITERTFLILAYADDNDARANLRNTKIVRLKKFDVHAISKAPYRIQNAVPVCVKLRVKKSAHVFQHNGARADLRYEPYRLREQIPFVVFSKLLGRD